MDFNDYLRDKAVEFRAEAEKAKKKEESEELKDLAKVCEEVASEIEEHQTGG